jgi:PAS domain S-box-containing protein
MTADDGYIPAGAESATKLNARLGDETPVSTTAGAETVDTAALHETIVEQMKDTAWVLDSDLRISYVNDRIIDRFALRASDLIGHPLQDLVQKGLLDVKPYEQLKRGLTELLAGDRSQFRTQLTLHPEGAPTYTTELIARPYRNSNDEIVGIVGTGRDITEQLADQRRMERQNDLFRQAQQLATIGGWAWDLTDDTIELTDEVYSIYEISADFEPTIENILQYHPDQTGAVREAIEQVEAGEPADLEARLQTASGAEKWVHLHGSPKQTDGEVTEVIGSVQDITERRQLETQLRHNVDSLRELYRLSADTTLSFADRIERVLELTCDRLGLSYGFLTTIEDERVEIIATHGDHEQLQPGHTVPLSNTYCRKTIQQDSLLAVKNAPEADWTTDSTYQEYGFDCYLGGAVSVDGRLYGTLCFADNNPQDRSFTDTELAFTEVLTKWVSYQLERQSAESKLRQLQETTQAFLTADDESAVAALAMDAATDILELPLTGLWYHDSTNDTLCPVAQTGEAAEQLGSQPQFESGEGLIWNAFGTDSVIMADDIQSEPDRYNKDTSIKSEIIVPMQSYGVLMTASLEQRSFSDLEVDLLRILAASVSAAMVRVDREAELKQQNEQLSEFTSYVSHDLRNPLSVAQGYVDQVKQTENIDKLEEVIRAHDRMKTLIEDMLLLARKGDIIGLVGSTHVEAVAQWAWEAVDSGDAEFTVTGELTINADASRLQQVFENLFRNSVEHGSTKNRTQSGDSVEHGSTDSQRDSYADDSPEQGGSTLTVAVECHEDRIIVTDDGPGFDGEPPPLSTDTHESESGLGLSIVTEIVEAHGWEITAQNGDPTGCRFEITGFETVD